GETIIGHDSVIGGNTFITEKDDDRVYMAKVGTNIKDLGIFAQYWKFDTSEIPDECDHHFDGEIYELGLTHPFGKGFKANAQYYYGKSDLLRCDYCFVVPGDKNGYELGVSYLGAKASTPGSWGAWVTYADRPAATYFKPTMFNTYAYNDADGWTSTDGYKGFEIGGNYAFAKNIVATLRYFVLEGRDDLNKREDNRDSKAKRQTLWADVTFTF
ncbi:MAG: putative porin, partial [Acidaminococcaceae bacterium]|nr:putative porin [Acidaminococcaceae bacterium]